VWVDRTDVVAASATLTAATDAAGLAPSGLRTIIPSLEDVFIAKLAADAAAHTTAAESADTSL
jgi:hypothetical protein